jgi:hypothetical protein
MKIYEISRKIFHGKTVGMASDSPGRYIPAGKSKKE